MSARPNFTDVDHTGAAIVLTGRSDPEPDGDILGIHVVLSQGEQSTPAVVDAVGGNWKVDIPAGGFDAGPATVVGVETRRENATTITWAQTVDIPKSPD